MIVLRSRKDDSSLIYIGTGELEPIYKHNTFGDYTTNLHRILRNTEVEKFKRTFRLDWKHILPFTTITYTRPSILDYNPLTDELTKYYGLQFNYNRSMKDILSNLRNHNIVVNDRLYNPYDKILFNYVRVRFLIKNAI